MLYGGGEKPVQESENKKVEVETRKLHHEYPELSLLVAIAGKPVVGLYTRHR